MNNDKPAPREWWIVFGGHCDSCGGTDQVRETNVLDGATHVIEHSAYAAVCAERDALMQTHRVLSEDAAELYGNQEAYIKERDAILKHTDDILADQDRIISELTIERDEARAEAERLEDLLEAVHETTLEADTKSRIRNNMDATPAGLKSKRNVALLAEAEAALDKTLNDLRNIKDEFSLPEIRRFVSETLARLRAGKGGAG